MCYGQWWGDRVSLEGCICGRRVAITRLEGKGITLQPQHIQWTPYWLVPLDAVRGRPSQEDTENQHEAAGPVGDVFIPFSSHWGAPRPTWRWGVGWGVLYSFEGHRDPLC